MLHERCYAVRCCQVLKRRQLQAIAANYNGGNINGALRDGSHIERSSRLGLLVNCAVETRKRMIGLSVSMRCAGPGSWIKVVHLPGYLSHVVQCFSLALANEAPRYAPRRTADDGDIIVDDAAEFESRDFLSRGRAVLLPEAVFTQLTFVRSQCVGVLYC